MQKVRLRGQTPDGQEVTFDLAPVIEKFGRLKGVEFNAIEFFVGYDSDGNEIFCREPEHTVHIVQKA